MPSATTVTIATVHDFRVSRLEAASTTAEKHHECELRLSEHLPCHGVSFPVYFNINDTP